MNKKLLYLIAIVCSIATQSFTQNVDFSLSNFPDKTIQFMQAQQDLGEGMDLFKEGPVRYKRAVILLEKANEFNPNNAQLNYNIGRCYMVGSFKNKAKNYFEKALELDNKVAPDIHFWIGWCHHLENNWTKANSEYELHKVMVLASKNEKDLKKIDKRLEEVSIGEQRVKKPVKVKIENLGPEINSAYTDYGPVISSEEDVLMFTSRRPGTTSGPEGDKDESIDEYWEDIYQSFSFNNKWTKAKNIGPPVNTDVHDATNNLSPDGEKLFINIDQGGQGDIYECDLVNLQWSKPSKMKDPINTKYHESSATINKGLDSMYFISERPGGLGARDIYLVTKDAKGKWGNLQNAGPTLNTEYSEEGVFLMPDGKTMYFSSEGHTSMGGFDIYKTVKSNGVWGTPVNIGYPINTSDDDVFFVVSANGEHGYYASYKNEGFGEKDIYKITFLEEDAAIDSAVAKVEGPKIIHGKKTANSTLMKGLVVDEYNQNPIENATVEILDKETNEVIEKFSTETLSGYYGVWVPSGKTLVAMVSAPSYKSRTDSIKVLPSVGKNVELVKNFPLQTKSDVTAIIKGNVIDAKSKKPLAATVKVVDVIANKEIATIATNPENGYYEVAVPTGKNYEMIVKSPDYQTAYDNGNIPVSQKNQELVKDFALNNLAVGAKIVLKNIFYDFDKATLRSQSIIELDHLITLLNDYPSMRIELSSHTDNRGTADYNVVLSNNRSKSCVDYLLTKGVNKLRLEYKGYGLTQPIAGNETDAGRQLNRRTEFKILSK